LVPFNLENASQSCLIFQKFHNLTFWLGSQEEEEEGAL
jgi:hypothetical protein